MLILVDSGGTHSFINQNFVQRTNLQTRALQSVSVKVANGAVLQCDCMVHDFRWWIQGITFKIDMRVMALGAYDAVFGMDWLQPLSPMTCHWMQKTLSFVYEGKHICIQGVQNAQPTGLSELSAAQLQKWCKGNEIWSVAVLERKPDAINDQNMNTPEAVHELLRQ